MMQARRKAHARRLATALLHKRAPLVMAQLVTLICLAGYVDHLIGLDSPSTKLIDACEYFSGDMAVTLGFREAGLKAVGYDVRYHQNGEMDLSTNHGFILAITGNECCGRGILLVCTCLLELGIPMLFTKW